MRIRLRFPAILAGMAVIVSLAGGLSSQAQQGGSDIANNPLLQEWDTPYGVPPFDRIENEHYLPALREGMKRQMAEIDAIVQNAEAPTFSNTIEALERTGADLTRVANVFYALVSAHSNDSIRETESTIGPEFSKHSDDITLNADLFARVKKVYENRDNMRLRAEQNRLLEETYKSFVRSGANLDDKAQERLREINSEMAELTSDFGQRLLRETNDFMVHTTNEADLGDLPASLVAAARQKAEDAGHAEGWAFTLQRPSINPFLQYSPNREMRKQLFMGYALRGDRDNDDDNKEILQRQAELRAERAKLMGYKTHAHYVLSDNMADNPKNAYKLLDQIWDPALRVAKEERAALEEMMKADGIDDKLRGWDWRYYAEKVRRARYDLDEEELRPYFEFNAVRQGVFDVSTRLFGLQFKKLDNVPTWHPDQEVYEVNEADGSFIGILYMDFFIRDSKRGGAWMNDLRAQSKLDGDVRPIVTNNFNYPPSVGDTPALLSFGEAATLFHEFGHALHGLLSDVTYASLSGTNVPRDFVEFPSQVMENWMGEPEVLRMFAKHYETGEVIPDELVNKITASAKFNQGFATVEYMAASYLDMAWHTMEKPQNKPARKFEDKEMERIGLIEEIIPRYRSTYFAHIFAGGYSAGYYSYIWSEILDADCFQAFKETSLFDQETAQRFRNLLAAGGTKPGMDLYRDFRGRDPVIEPLLERRGLTGSGKSE